MNITGNLSSLVLLDDALQKISSDGRHTRVLSGRHSSVSIDIDLEREILSGDEIKVLAFQGGITRQLEGNLLIQGKLKERNFLMS